MYSWFLIGSFIVFIFSERTLLHFSRTARRAIWYVLSCVAGIVLVRWLQTIEGMGMVWVFLSAVLAASVVEDEVLKKTGLIPMNIEATHRLRASYRTAEAQGMAERIVDIVGVITKGKGYTAGTKQLVSRVSGATQRLQRGLHRVLATASMSELNYILCAINVPALLEVADRSTTNLLVGTRLADLTTVSRATLVDGLQKLGLRYRPQRQIWVRDVILSIKGMQLTYFKAYIDDGGDYHTMYKLVYNDLQGEIKSQVIKHLQKEGSIVLEALQSRGQVSEDIPPGAVLKVLSDIDDTVFCSGGSFPAGVDTRYPRKCYYPGVLALYSALDRCFAQRFVGIIEPLSYEPLENCSVCDKECRVTDKDQDNQYETETTFDEKIPRKQSSSSLAEDSLELVRQNVPGACLREGHEGRWPSDQRVFSPPSGRTSPVVSRTSSIAHSNLFLGGTSPTPPLQMFLSEIATPRESNGFTEDLASPRLDLFLESRATSTLNRHQEGSNLVLLSARPESYKGLTESESYRKYFQPLVLRGELDTSPTMLLGSLDSGPKALFKLLTGSWLLPDDPNPKTATAALYQTLAAKKLSRFREYAAIYPEAAFIYFGDNGQGDILCAEIMYDSARDAAAPRPSQLLASFINRVVPPKATLSMLRSSKRSDADIINAWNERNIFLHRTHVGMAVQAYDLGLLDIESLYRVGIAARQDFCRIMSRYGGRHAGRRLDKAAHHLNEDMERLNARLPSSFSPLEALFVLRTPK